MRAERDAFAERLRHVEAVTLQQDTSAVEELQVIALLLYPPVSMWMSCSMKALHHCHSVSANQRPRTLTSTSWRSRPTWRRRGTQRWRQSAGWSRRRSPPQGRPPRRSTPRPSWTGCR